MSKSDSGGPVYPENYFAKGGQIAKSNGITRRDLTAIEAMKGVVSCIPSWFTEPTPEKIAVFSYKLADAMIAESRKEAK